MFGDWDAFILNKDVEFDVIYFKTLCKKKMGNSSFFSVHPLKYRGSYHCSLCKNLTNDTVPHTFKG